jgi:hypothetical protein
MTEADKLCSAFLTVLFTFILGLLLLGMLNTSVAISALRARGSVELKQTYLEKRVSAPRYDLVGMQVQFLPFSF